MFPYSNRVMHIEQKPEEMFPGEQGNTRNCSEAGKYFKKKTFRNLFTQVYSRDFGAKSLREENSRPKAKPNNVSSCEQQDNFF